MWEQAGAILDARLEPRAGAPLAVAFSGGGDSMALLLAAAAWCRARSRPLLALTVDHGLRPESEAWAKACRLRAARLGVEHRTLTWEGGKPRTGLSAAAREARHRLLADAARRAGAAVILMGHTADDREEAAMMRREGSTVPTPRVWSPSPVWPQGRGLFILRPLLDARRAAIRAALSAPGETWIDDPLNTDPLSARARARAALDGGPITEGRADDGVAPRTLDVLEGPAGDLEMTRLRLAETDGGALLGAALVCAAGRSAPPRREAIGRLLARVGAGERFTATLAGARLDCDGARVRLARDAGEHRRGRSGDLDLPSGEPRVWDGRFELTAGVVGSRVGLLAGRAARLPPDLRRALAGVPAAARPALPVVLFEGGDLELPTLRPGGKVAARSLALARLAAARGAIMDEAALRRMAKTVRPS